MLRYVHVAFWRCGLSNFLTYPQPMVPKRLTDYHAHLPTLTHHCNKPPTMSSHNVKSLYPPPPKVSTLPLGSVRPGLLPGGRRSPGSTGRHQCRSARHRSVQLRTPADRTVNQYRHLVSPSVMSDRTATAATTAAPPPPPPPPLGRPTRRLIGRSRSGRSPIGPYCGGRRPRHPILQLNSGI